MPHKHTAIYVFISLSLALSAEAAAPNKTPQVETVLVVGQRYKAELVQEQALTPGSVTLLDSDDLQDRTMVSLEDMLRYVPGVWSASGSTGDSSFFSSRGSNLDATNYDGNGIKLMQDGLPVTTADGNNHNRIMDPLSARYVIVAHGANALTYGASTLGGAIDFITPTARDTQPEINLSGGSHGQLQGRITTGAVAGNFDGLLSLEARQWDGYRAHQEQEREGIYANAGWKLNSAVQTRLFLTYIDNNQQLPGALTREQFQQDPQQAQASAVTGNFQYNVETWRAANKTIWDMDKNSSLSIGFSFESQNLYHPIVDKVMVDFDGAGPNPPVEVFSLLIDTQQETAGTSLRYNARVGDHDVLAGLNYANTSVQGGNYRNDNGRRNGITTRVDNDATSTEAFLVDRWQLAPQWNLVFGAQAISSERDVKNTDVKTGDLYNPRGDFNSLSPRAGVIFQAAKDVEFFANLSRLYEAPTNFELQDDVSPDNKALDAMHGSVIELGTRGKQSLFNAADYWRWDLAIYYAKLTDEILSVDDPKAPGTSLSANVDSTIHAGIEALLGASFALDANNTGRIEPLVSITLNEFSFDNDMNYGNNQLPAAPGYAIKGEIIYRHSNGLFAGPTFDIVDKRFGDFANRYVIDAYSLIGLRAGFATKNWQGFAELRNLGDKNYVGTHSVVNAGAANSAILSPGEPRSAYLGVKLRF